MTTFSQNIRLRLSMCLARELLVTKITTEVSINQVLFAMLGSFGKKVLLVTQ
jgi:hypothetical protein